MFIRKAILIFGLLFLSMSLSNLAKADFVRGLEAHGRGDYETALKEWLIDANQGDAIAQFNLGVMYEFGEGVPENDAEAMKLYRLAADQGYADAQINLGNMYARGEAVPSNFIIAYMWYSLATAQGFEGAHGNKEILNQNMTPEQIAEAERLAQEWLEEHQ